MLAPEARGGFKRVESLAAYEGVVQELQRLIHLGELLPGDTLPAERLLAEQLGVARVTLREAIRILQSDGVVRVVGKGSNRRTVVLPPRETVEQLQARLRGDLDALMDIYDLRAAVEPVAARLAAERRTGEELRGMEDAIADLRDSRSIATFCRADSAFHLAIADAARNARLQPIIEETRAALYRATDVLEHDAALPRSVRDHRQVFLAIQKGQPSRAESAMRRHVEFARQEMLSLLGADRRSVPVKGGEEKDGS
jgi:GntR family transcriptional regulator, transcriptional repressor for pyruvate dehydrogenase complex